MTQTRKGYSLIELVIAIGLLALILVGGVRLFVTSLRGAQKATNIGRVRENGDTALVAIERSIRPGNRAIDNHPACSIEYPSGYEDASQDLVQFLDATGVRRLRIVNDSGDILNITSPEVDVVNGTFDCNPDVVNGTVSVVFTLRAGQGQAAYQKPFQTVVKMRNAE